MRILTDQLFHEITPNYAIAHKCNSKSSVGNTYCKGRSSMAKLNLTKKESTEQLSDKDNDSWKILVINDEQEVHTITRLALNNFRFTDRDIDVLSVYSVAGAGSVLESELIVCSFPR